MENDKLRVYGQCIKCGGNMVSCRCRGKEPEPIELDEEAKKKIKDIFKDRKKKTK